MSHAKLILSNLPNVEVLAVCVFVFTLIILTWQPENKSVPTKQMTYANSRITRTLAQCMEYPITLEGPMALDLENPPDLELLARFDFSEVQPGGSWASSKCRDPLTVAVIIPFRDVNGDRARNLKYLIMQLHYILQRHMLKYVIIVSQQNGTEGSINKRLLMNLAFQHINRDEYPNYSCVVFNDIDFIPTSDVIFYGCDSENPKHMSAYINDKIIPKDDRSTNGVLSMPSKVFLALNGFSNRLGEWDDSDHNMYERLSAEAYILERADPGSGQYLYLGDTKGCCRNKNNPTKKASYKTDGLSSLQDIKVQLLESKHLPLYTLLNYAVDQPEPPKLQ